MHDREYCVGGGWRDLGGVLVRLDDDDIIV